MKTKINLLASFLFYSILNNYAQNECGIKDRSDHEFINSPWYGNNQYLYDLIDSLEQNTILSRITPQGEIENWIYRLPIFFTSNFIIKHGK